MRIQIDLKKCKKSGQCYYMRPDLIRQGADNLPEIIVADLHPDKAGDAEELIDLCPTGAIDLVD